MTKQELVHQEIPEYQFDLPRIQEGVKAALAATGELPAIPFISFYSPGDTPIAGMFSYPDPASLTDGQFALLKNLRVSNRIAKARDGIAQLATGPAGSGTGTFRGGAIVTYSTISPGDFIYEAHEISGAIRVFETQNLSSWTEITAGSGKYGDTRLTAGTGEAGVVHFQVVKKGHPYSGEVLVFCNEATAAPRCYDVLAGSSGTARIETVNLPYSVFASNAQVRVLDRFPAWFKVWTDPATVGRTITNSDATGLTLAFLGTWPNDDVSLLLADGGTLSNGDNSIYDVPLAEAISVTSSMRQFIMCVESAQIPEQWFSKLKIELQTAGGASNFVIHDPADPKTKPSVVSTDQAGKELWVFPMDHLQGTIAGQSIRRIRFTWVGNPTAASVSANIYMMAFGGSFQGGAEYALTYENGGSRTESRPIVIGCCRGELFRNMDSTPLSGLEIPDSPLIYYSKKIYYQWPDATTLGLGVDRIHVYEKRFTELGNAPFIHAQETVYNTYSGSWPTTNALTIQSTDLDYNALNENRLMPTALHIPMPSFGTAIATSNRLVVSKNARVFISEFGNPFRYREVAPIDENGYDPRSPSLHEMPGYKVRALSETSSSSLGSNSIFAHVDKGLFVLPLSDTRLPPSFISTVGIAARGSVARYKDQIWFLDDTYRVRTLEAGGIADWSRGIIDDKLDASPTARTPLGVGIVHKDRYYLAVTPNGGSYNTRVMVFDSRSNMWYEDSFPAAVEVEQWIFAQPKGTTLFTGDKLLAFGNDGTIYEYEQPSLTTDVGAVNIAIELRTRKWHKRMWERLIFSRSGIVADGVNSTNLSVEIIPDGGASSVSTTISLNPAGSLRWRWTDIVGTEGVAAQYRLSGSVPGGWNLYSWGAEMTDGIIGGADA